MPIETATYVNDLVSTNPAGTDQRATSDDHHRMIKGVLKATFPGMSGVVWRTQTKGGAYTVVGTDNMTVLDCSVALTLNLTAGATLGSMMFVVHARGGDVVIDPAGAELVNGAATLTVPTGSFATVYSTTIAGNEFRVVVSDTAGHLTTVVPTTGWYKTGADSIRTPNSVTIDDSLAVNGGEFSMNSLLVNGWRTGLEALGSVSPNLSRLFYTSDEISYNFSIGRKNSGTSVYTAQLTFADTGAGNPTAATFAGSLTVLGAIGTPSSITSQQASASQYAGSIQISTLTDGDVSRLLMGSAGNYFAGLAVGRDGGAGSLAAYIGFETRNAAGAKEERMRLDSAGLLSLTGNLTVSGGTTVLSGNGAVIQAITAGTSQKFLWLQNTGGNAYFGIESSTAGGFFTGTNAYDTVIYSPADDVYVRTTALRVSSLIALGANYAAAGIIRIPNNNAITARNAANTGDLNLIYADASNVIQVGGGAAVTVGGNLTVSGTTTDNTFAKSVAITGTVANHQTSAIVLTQSSSTTSQIRAYGADAATAGVLELLQLANDGSPAYTHTFSNAGALTLAGNLTVSGTGPHAIGGATSQDVQLLVTGAFAGVSQTIAVGVGTTLNPPINTTGKMFSVVGTINKAGSGTHADFTGIFLEPFTIGAGAATLTNASTLKISAAPTGAINNYALWVAGGDTLLAGNLTVSGGTITESAAVVGGYVSANVINTDNTNAASGAYAYIKTGGASAGDPSVIFNVNGATDWALGIDNSDSDAFVLSVGTALGTGNVLRMSTAGLVCINDTSNANMTLGLTINQGANDNEILTFKSSDVAHGTTGVAETDTYGYFSKSDIGGGGLNIVAVNGTNDYALLLQGVAANGSTTKSSSAFGAVMVYAMKKNGTAPGSLGANENMFCVRDNVGSATRFILDNDGDSHQDVGTAWTNFDHLDDIATLDALSYNVARADDPIKRKFGEWMIDKRPELTRHKIVTFNDDGHHFVNMSKLTMLHTGAIRQLGEKHDALLAELTAVKEQMKQLENKHA